MLARWRSSGTDGLLLAAEDDCALVRAVAWDALLHVGETDSDVQPWAAPVPLLSIERRELGFVSRGGCNARIGPIIFTAVPLDLPLRVVVRIGRLGFDPFTAEAEFSHSYTPPEVLASELLEHGGADWLRLTARCRWIAEHMAAVVERVQSQSSLQILERQLRQRAASYAAFAEHLSTDLGIDWQAPAGLEPSDTVRAESEASYIRLRRLFARANRQVSNADPDPEISRGTPDNSIRATVQGHRLDSGASIFGIGVDGSISLAEEVHAASLLSTVQVDRLNGGIVMGIAARRLAGTAPLVPTILDVRCSMSIDRCRQDSVVRGIVFERVDPEFRAWRPVLTLNIDRLDGGTVWGVVVGRDPGLAALTPSPAEAKASVDPRGNSHASRE